MASQISIPLPPLDAVLADVPPPTSPPPLPPPESQTSFEGVLVVG